MLRLTIEDQTTDIISPGLSIAVLAALNTLRKDWPGVASHDVRFIDPIFGHYRTLEDLDRKECEAAEEETDEWQDATATTEAEECAALDGIAEELERGEQLEQVGEHISPDNIPPLEGHSVPVDKRSQDSGLALIDIKVRP